MSDTYERHVPSRAEIAVGMLAGAIRRWADRGALARFMQGNPAEADRLAQDLKTDRQTLLDLTGKGRDSATLLPRRMRLLGIDAEQLRRGEPAVAQDLSRCCSLCGSKRRCATDMADEERAREEARLAPQVESWRTYCPNEPTLESLRPAAAEGKA